MNIEFILKYWIYILVVIGMIIFAINFLTISSNFLSMFAILLVLIGPATIEYQKFKEMKSIEDRFPDFLRDISVNIRAGMTLPQAIVSTKKTNYGKLTPHVKRIANQVDWGVPFDSILEEFSTKNSPLIKRTVATIIETHKGGGNIAEILDSVARNVIELNKIRKERASTIYSQVVTGYIIFFVFLGVLISLQTYLLPGLSVASPEIGLTGGVEELYSQTFLWLVVIQGFFSGLVVGKISEGKLIAGLKHSLILMAVGYIALSIF